jgi:hypothetical protein
LIRQSGQASLRPLSLVVPRAARRRRSAGVAPLSPTPAGESAAGVSMR